MSKIGFMLRENRVVAASLKNPFIRPFLFLILQSHFTNERYDGYPFRVA